jgi:hypothetical protein
MIRFVSLAAFGLVVACASPQERCERDAARDLNVLNGLIAESEATLERGYAFEEIKYPDVNVRVCYNDDGRAFVCGSNRIRTERRPVAVDLEAEERKLASLKAKRRELVLRTQQELAACQTLPNG